MEPKFDDFAKFLRKFKMDKGVAVLDLHEYSHGSGFIAVRFFQQECKKQGAKRFIAVTGQGALEDGNHLAFRRDLMQLIQDRCANELSVTSCPENPGRVRVLLGMG